MKGKRYTTEDKIRLLREADQGDKCIADICREANLSEVTFHRWKKQFGHLEVNEARHLISSGGNLKLACDLPPNFLPPGCYRDPERTGLLSPVRTG